MIERTIETSIQHRWLVCAAGIVLGVWGAYAAWRTPIDAIPDLSENQVIVFTDWQEHGPGEVEAQITQPLADKLKGLVGVRTVRTSSDVGYSMIHVIFDDWVEQAAARREVAERLAVADADLPAGVRPRLAPDAPATGQIFWYVVEGGELDLGARRSLQDWLVGPQLATVAGVAEVASVGGFPTELAIEVDPDELAARGISLEPIASAVARASRTFGGQVVPKGGAEFLVRSAGGIGFGPNHEFRAERAIDDLGQISVPAGAGRTIPLKQLARISVVPGIRRGVLEMNGSETVGGVVLMRRGENPLAVTRGINAKIEELQASLPAGVRIVSGYDRSPLVHGAIGTVTRSLLEAVAVACLCVLLILVHVRSSLVIAIALPLATLAAFVGMSVLRLLGWSGIETNIMSLAGLAISVGVLVDSSIVMTENVMHRLRLRFGDEPVRGDVHDIVLDACRTVGRPIFFSILIMLVSFVPVFALGGLEGKMFRPLATTKTFALVAAALLAITVVPALCSLLIRGRIRGEHTNWIVGSVAGVYRPVLSYLLDRPAVMVWVMGITFLCGFAPLGSVWLSRLTLLAVLLAAVFVVRGWKAQALCLGSFLLVALVAPQIFRPLPRAFLAPLDEGTVMDMPITVPRVSVAQATDDLKARDMILCRFPEVAMVMGKAGRAETPTDPAPIDMIETMIGFRPRAYWPRRKLVSADAQRQTAAALDALVQGGLLIPPASAAERQARLDAATNAALFAFDAQLREFAWQRQQEQLRELRPQLIDCAVQQIVADLRLVPPLSPEAMSALTAAASEQLPKKQLMGPPSVGESAGLIERTLAEFSRLKRDPAPAGRPGWFQQASGAAQRLVGSESASPAQRLQVELADLFDRHWRQHVARLDAELVERGAELYTRLVLEELLVGGVMADPKAAEAQATMRRLRTNPPRAAGEPAAHHGVAAAPLPDIEPVPGLSELQAALAGNLVRRLVLLRKDRADLTAVGGEFDQTLQMPGWANVWTMPIQNRVDMLATGVNTDLGIRVLGRRLDEVARVSDEIAAVVERLPGAAGVVSDPIRGKGYLDIQLDRAKAAQLGLDPGAFNDAVEAALGGKVVAHLRRDRGSLPVRLSFSRRWREDEEALRSLPLAIGPSVAMAPSSEGPGDFVPLGQVADVRIVEGPATIKGENGLLRSYVRLNVRGRDAGQFVDEARRAVAQQVRLPAGVYIQWTGQFEHQQRSFGRLLIIVPLVIGSILLLLYWTYRDLADALLMLLAVPGAIAGGVLLQWLLGETLSVTVIVGYIACLGMATATGVIMLVYLREAVEKAGGMDRLSLEELRQAVLDGAVHRLRPKLLTEATTIIGLAPVLWATGVGAEVIRPMAVPVLGGILIADEVIDLFLPVMFYWVRRRRILARRSSEELNHATDLPAAA